MAMDQAIHKRGIKKLVAQQQGKIMGWEKRGSGQYYYQKKRVNGRVVSQYVGSGILAEASQMLDQAEKGKRDLEKIEQQAEKERVAALDQAVDQNLVSIGELIESTLIAYGYHKVKGEWRKKRTNPKNKTI